MMCRGPIASLLLAAVVLSGCPSKPKNGECKTSDDCKEQQGYGKVCVQGRCQECQGDGDCKAGFVCRVNRCTPRPECETGADCPGGGACVEGKCKAAASKAECESDAQCSPGQTCSQGRCVTRTDPARAAAEAIARCLGGRDIVHFAFDGHDLDAQGRDTLTELATCLKGAGGPARLVVEGHCDERGTSEYNIQLGARRAEAVRTYLTDLGVDAANLRATSYGKERPACTAHDEACWAKNRRGVVVPDAGAPSPR